MAEICCGTFWGLRAAARPLSRRQGTRVGGGNHHRTGRHGYRLTSGTLYPILHHLEAAGYLTANATVVCGKRRKNYRITKTGRKLLCDAREKLRELVAEVLEGREQTHSLPVDDQ